MNDLRKNHPERGASQAVSASQAAASPAHRGAGYKCSRPAPFSMARMGTGRLHTPFYSEEIVHITVSINGVEQEVVFGEGGNVELRTADSPDPPTGCHGLKFDFPLDKVYGTMRICFEFTVS